jgi:hypothetical protein
MRKQITYVFDEDDGFDFYAVRVQVKTLTLQGLGEYSKLNRMYEEHLRTIVGGDWDKMSLDERREVDADVAMLVGMYRQWAHMRTALAEVWVAPDEKSFKKAAWNSASLTDLGWHELTGLGTLPMDLFGVWDKAAQDCNPGLFGPVFGNDEESEKKVGVISVE